MNTGDTEQEHNSGMDDPDQSHIGGSDSGQETGGDKPTPDEETVKKAKEDVERYKEDRPTVVLPGSDGTVSGTAINDWLDDDGNPKYNSESDAADNPSESRTADHQ